MPFTAEQVQNAMAQALDFHITDGVLDNTVQEKPLMKALVAKQKDFPGGKEYITKRVKGQRVTTIEGYSHDDQVTYRNPAKVKEAKTRWRELHAGIEFTYTEAKQDGVMIMERGSAPEKVTASNIEKTRLSSIIEDKVNDMQEGWDESFNKILWLDGTQDSKVFGGVTSFVLDNPAAAGATFNIDRVANSWWRNRAVLGLSTAAPGDQLITNTIQSEMRQIRRYGGISDILLAGSDFLDALEAELKAKGNYTLSGWAKNGGSIDMSIADVSFKGTVIQYDPTLDDIGRAKYFYALDSRRIGLYCMENQDRVTHHPERPHDQYVIYEGMTWTGGLLCTQLNVQEVFSIA